MNYEQMLIEWIRELITMPTWYWLCLGLWLLCGWTEYGGTKKR
jgi:hypothetical protein